MKNKIFTNTFFVAIIALLCCALWGSATPFIKIGYELIRAKEDVPSTILFAGARFFFAGIITVIFTALEEENFFCLKNKMFPKLLW